MEEKRREGGSPSPAGEFARFGEASADSTISRRRGGGLKRKASGLSGSPSSAPPSKRTYRDKANAPLPPHQIHNGPLTRARQLSDSAATLSAINSSKKESLPPSQAARQEQEELNAARKVFEALEAAVDSEFEAIRSRDGNAHIIPVPAGWFSWSDVHPIEKHALPSFFNGKLEGRGPEMYVEIRNWIMNKFHSNPHAKIGSKDLAELSVGELDARQEIMDFLDYWGLINYHSFLPKDLLNININTDVDKTEKVDSDSLIEKLYRFETEQSDPLLVPRVSAQSSAAGLFRESAIAEELGKQEGPSVEYHCNSCSADCSRKRYHCQKQADFDLCGECYNNGKFGSDMSPSDFILMEFAEVSSASGGRWTDQETLLLLEALELYKENWNEIAEHVATKTKAQCILHFLQMPIEDNFLDFDDETEDSSQGMAEPKTTMSDDTSEDPNSAKAETVADQTSRKIDSSAAKDASETPENRTCLGNNEPTSSAAENLNAEDTPSGKVIELGCQFGVKALKEAFEAVGCLPGPQDKISFADAGNPVMALAAFLTRLVDPGITTASARSSVKAMDCNSPEVRLALRHCMLLQDDPAEKGHIQSESAAVEKVDQSTGKEDEEKVAGEMKQSEKNTDIQKQNPEDMDLDNVRNEHVVEDKVNSGADLNTLAPCEKQDEAAEKPPTVEKPNGGATDELNNLNEPRNDLPKEEAPDPVRQSTEVLSSTLEIPPGSGQQAEATSEAEGPQSKEASKDADKESIDLPKQESAVVASAVEDGAKTGVGKTKGAKSGSETDDPNTERLKRAAVTTLAAAAVKAKLLADQEEEEIQHTAALLIDKQLRKLEVKMSLFSDMDHAISRVREQLDRSRQKLYHERAQIIAARLGLPPSSSRPVGPGNPTMRPPMNVAAARPAGARPTMTSSPATSVVGGVSMQPLSQ